MCHSLTLSKWWTYENKDNESKNNNDSKPENDNDKNDPNNKENNQNQPQENENPQPIRINVPWDKIIDQLIKDQQQKKQNNQQENQNQDNDNNNEQEQKDKNNQNCLNGQCNQQQEQSGKDMTDLEEYIHNSTVNAGKSFYEP